MSILIPAITGLLQDSSIAQAAAHLANVASIPVVGVSGIREVLAAGGETDAEQVAAKINEAMSVYRLLMIDKETEDFNRVAVSFSGLNDLLERVERRLAANHNPPIPFTKWQGESPGGLGHNGRWRGTQLAQGAVQPARDLHRPPGRAGRGACARCGAARGAGVRVAKSLIEMGDKERAEVELIDAQTSKAKAEAVQVAIMAAVMDEDEGKDVLRADSLFEDHLTDAAAPGPPDPEPMPGINGKVPARAGMNGA